METTTFVPSDRPQQSREIVAEGKYKAIIVAVERKQQDKVIPSRTEDGVNHVADMLQVEYKISDENANHAGRHIWSSPIWIWKDTPHIKALGLDTLLHVPNTNNNFRYHKILGRYVLLLLCPTLYPVCCCSILYTDCVDLSYPDYFHQSALSHTLYLAIFLFLEDLLTLAELGVSYLLLCENYLL